MFDAWHPAAIFLFTQTVWHPRSNQPGSPFIRIHFKNFKLRLLFVAESLTLSALKIVGAASCRDIRTISLLLKI
jgi:hypothetical protein